MKSNQVILGVLSGIAAGALLSMLVSTAKCARIKKQIVRLGENYLGEIKKKFNELSEALIPKSENGFSSVERIPSRVKPLADESISGVPYRSI